MRRLALWALALGACSDGEAARPNTDADAGDAGDAAPSPLQCGSLPAPNEACATCQRASCCDQATSCADDPACASFEACHSGCRGDGACISDCVAATTAAEFPDRWPALAACRASACAEACGATCGRDLPFASTPQPGCTECVVDKCCEPAAACASDLACAQLYSCLQSCTDVACRGACLVHHPTGLAKSDALDVCFATSGCALGSCGFYDLACTDSMVWPVPTGPFGLQLALRDAQTDQPWAGVQVLACSRPAVECTPTSALAGDTTDSSGAAGLVSQGLEVAWVRADGPGDFLPSLIFFRPHLTHTSFRGAWVYPLSSAIQQMASATVVDPKKAQLHVFVTDCQRRRLRGAVVELSMAGKALPVVYSRSDSTPDPVLKETGVTGEARSLNIPITEADGFPLVDIVVKKGGKQIAHTSVRIRAGYWSELWELGPTPASE